MDAERAYTGFRFGEQSLGQVTRNVIWAESLATEGRGVVFGVNWTRSFLLAEIEQV